MEGKIVVGKKRVLESKKKKRRRMILIDSESDEDNFVISPRNNAKSDFGLEGENGSNKKRKIDVESKDVFALDKSNFFGVSEIKGKFEINEKTKSEKFGGNELAVKEEIIAEAKENIEKVMSIDCEAHENGIGDDKLDAIGEAKTESNPNSSIEFVERKEGIGCVKSENVSRPENLEREKIITVSEVSQSSSIKSFDFIGENKQNGSMNGLDGVEENEVNGSMKSENVSRVEVLKSESAAIVPEVKVLLKPKVVNVKEQIFDMKKNATFGRKENSNEKFTSKEEKNVGKRNDLKSIFVKKREQEDSIKKKDLEFGSERKRKREIDNEFSLKKQKSVIVKQMQERSIEIGEKRKRETDNEFSLKKQKSVIVKQMQERSIEIGEKRTEGKMLNPGVNKYDSRSYLSSSIKSGSVNKCRDESNERTMRRNLKDHHTFLGVTGRDNFDISPKKGIRVPSKSGVLRVLPSNKKVGGIEGAQNQREEKGSGSSKSNEHLLFHEGKVEKSVSTIKSVNNSETKLKAKGSVMNNLNRINKANKGPGATKRKIGDQLKEILLDAGWKIEWRPRKGKNYMDAVYFPPNGGSGLWSIPKAYAVHMKNLKENDSLPQNTSKSSEGCDNSTLATVPTDLLKCIRRNVVNKRRSSEEINSIDAVRLRKKKTWVHLISARS